MTRIKLSALSHVDDKIDPMDGSLTAIREVPLDELDPIGLRVEPDGKLGLVDGHHRLKLHRLRCAADIAVIFQSEGD